jgi:predicted DNA-binding transcriptional regulator YafY
LESEQGWAIPLEHLKEGKKVYFRYSDLDFSINNQKISELEIEQLKSALLVLSKFEGIPQFDWVAEVTDKLDKALKIGNSSKTIISFDNNRYVKGIEYIGDLFNAVLYNKVLLISYKSFKSEISHEFTIHPYHIKQFSNRWFLFGHNEAFNDLSTLALDRIEKIEELQSEFIPSEIDFETYFEDVIGVTVYPNVKTQKIQLLFNENMAPYIITKPIHGSQRKLQFDKNGLLIEIDVIPNFELEQLILSHGENVKIISPESLKSKIKKRLELTFQNYKANLI